MSGWTEGTEEAIRMGRIVANVKLQNLLDPEKVLECDALVDTG